MTVGALVALISLDMTQKLVQAGVIAKTLSIVSATNATPIVLATSVPHDILPAAPAHGVVTGVGGNVAANGVWQLTPTDATHLALYNYSPQGVLTPVAGTGSYTSGGTIQIAFPDGRVLLGRRHVPRYSRPPRVVFVPWTLAKYEFQSYGGAIPPAVRPPTLASQTAEQLTMLLQRQIGTEKQRFEVHCWGAAVPPSPDFGDFDVTRALYNQVVQSVFSLATGMDILSGLWKSQAPSEVPGAGQWSQKGQEYVMVLSIDQPVLDNALSFVPASTSGTITANFVGGSTGDDILIDVP